MRYRDVVAGSIYKHKSGAWVLRAYVGRDPLTGKKIWKARSFRGSKREAERALAALVAEVPSAQPAAPARTFGELLERWFEARSGDWSPSTAQQTRWTIEGSLNGLADRKVSSLGVEDLDRFYAALRQRGGRGGRPLAGSTVARVHGIVRLALGQAVMWGWRADNPAERANRAGTTPRRSIRRLPTRCAGCSLPRWRRTTSC